ncbi:MAG: magnesium transporter [Fusobacterium perfoetens]|uniref:magnesium transporter n=1 Tax=Fusobacterium perfoetens TaxID=852 RepID=UPI0023F29558|nr:magnesium transporter [Fusobacterium perfoetens]MCI6152407.1 magnesium transporter [Fusobacterium perfoetens]MDY3237006.1 magnesium transporter [Fusobacterium perfoetens]
MFEKIVRELLEKKDLKRLQGVLNSETPVKIIEFFENNEENEKDLIILFRLLNKERAAEVFAELDPDMQMKLISSINDEKLQGLLEELYFDDMIDFIEEMPSNVVKRVLENYKNENRSLINQFLSYEEDSAGSLMTIEYLSIKSNWTVKDSLLYIRKKVEELETIDVAYVTENKKLIGEISLKNLLISNDDDLIENIMNKNILYVTTSTNQEEAIDLFKKYDLTVLPVIDKENILVGIITIDDVVDAIEEENTEDFQKMAAMAPSKEEYLDSSVFQLAKNRLTWLLVLMVSATFTGTIISKYENIIEQMVVLAAAIPMLMDTGGNAGSQSSTLVIRGMALGEIKDSDCLKVLWKELRVSMIVGIGLGLVNFLRMKLILKNDLKISLLVSLTLGVVVVIAKLVGGLLPIGAKKLKLDPAIMAGPLVTTIVDALALVIYFYMAMLLYKDVLNI